MEQREMVVARIRHLAIPGHTIYVRLRNDCYQSARANDEQRKAVTISDKLGACAGRSTTDPLHLRAWVAGFYPFTLTVRRGAKKRGEPVPEPFWMHFAGYISPWPRFAQLEWDSTLAANQSSDRLLQAIDTATQFRLIDDLLNLILGYFRTINYCLNCRDHGL